MADEDPTSLRGLASMTADCKPVAELRLTNPDWYRGNTSVPDPKSRDENSCSEVR
jgi:hypothetical protein